MKTMKIMKRKFSLLGQFTHALQCSNRHTQLIAKCALFPGINTSHIYVTLQGNYETTTFHISMAFISAVLYAVAAT